MLSRFALFDEEKNRLEDEKEGRLFRTLSVAIVVTYIAFLTAVIAAIVVGIVFVASHIP